AGTAAERAGGGSDGVPPSPRLESRKEKPSKTTPSLLRFWPVCLSSHWSRRSRPSTRIGLPFLKYWAMTSACRPKESTSTKVTSSFFSHASFFKLLFNERYIFFI